MEAAQGQTLKPILWIPVWGHLEAVEVDEKFLIINEFNVNIDSNTNFEDWPYWRLVLKFTFADSLPKFQNPDVAKAYTEAVWNSSMTMWAILRVHM